MAWSVQQVIEKYGELYHVTSPENESRILKLGLINCAESRKAFGDRSYEAAVDEFGLRQRQVRIGSKEDAVLLNDQIPMLNGALTRCELPSDMSPQAWAAYLDTHIFFWASKKRLGDFLYTREKRKYKNVVFRVQTAALLTALPTAVRISMQNSGAPYPPKPSPRYRFTTFQEGETAGHWFYKNGNRKHVVEVVVQERPVPPILLGLMSEEEWRPLATEPKMQEEKKKKARKR